MTGSQRVLNTGSSLLPPLCSRGSPSSQPLLSFLPYSLSCFVVLERNSGSHTCWEVLLRSRDLKTIDPKEKRREQLKPWPQRRRNWASKDRLYTAHAYLIAKWADASLLTFVSSLLIVFLLKGKQKEYNSNSLSPVLAKLSVTLFSFTNLLPSFETKSN